MFWMKLNREEWKVVMNDSLIGPIIFISEQSGPTTWKIINIDSVSMILRGHVAVLSSIKSCWLVVASVAIPAVINVRHNFERCLSQD